MSIKSRMFSTTFITKQRNQITLIHYLNSYIHFNIKKIKTIMSVDVL